MLSRYSELERMRVQLMEIIFGSTGMWATTLERAYKDKYQCNLDVARYGHVNIISFLFALGGFVRVERPFRKGDWLIRDGRLPPDGNTAALITSVGPGVWTLIEMFTYAKRYNLADLKNEIPRIFPGQAMPEDCFYEGDMITSQRLNDFKPGARVELYLSEINSPSHFWVNRLFDNDSDAIDEMLDEMSEYYSNGEGAERFFDPSMIRRGIYCSCFITGSRNRWYRAVVMSFVGRDRVKVLHVDRGSTAVVDLDNIKPLLRRFGVLPGQAIRARLAAVRPPPNKLTAARRTPRTPAAGVADLSTGASAPSTSNAATRGPTIRRWSAAAIAYFVRMVQDRIFVGNVVAVDHKEKLVELLLIDTTTPTDLNISKEFIRSGYAEFRPIPAIKKNLPRKVMSRGFIVNDDFDSENDADVDLPLLLEVLSLNSQKAATQ